MEEVDILLPPLFKPSGHTKFWKQAYLDGDWIGAFNLWVLSRNPEPAIIYQQRSPGSSWAPSLLDVSAAGMYKAGEKLTDGLREAEEELGKRYNPKDTLYLGKRLFVGFNVNGSSHNNVVDVYMIEDNSSLDSYILDETEVYAICNCPIAQLLKVQENDMYSFEVPALLQNGEATTISVNKDSFPENWDNYHYKIALLAQRYFKNDRNLIY